VTPTWRASLIGAAVIASVAILSVAFQSDIARAMRAVLRIAKSEAHLALFKWNSQGLTGEVPYSGPPLLVVAHAGGEVGGRRYRNAMEGLDQSVERGCRYVELDFNWTADGRLVVTHSWTSFFGDPLETIPTEKEFLDRARSDGLTQMSLAHVVSWLAAHPGISLVTDVKVRNLDALRLVAATGVRQQIAPQVYRFSEFEEARKLGFSRVIFTNYVMQYTDSALVRFAAAARPFAITVPHDHASGALAARLSALNVPLFTHPVDTLDDARRLPRQVRGIYSSTLCGVTKLE
jgi:glycerophosphoryl diester phosphodiesterase